MTTTARRFCDHKADAAGAGSVLPRQLPGKFCRDHQVIDQPNELGKISARVALKIGHNRRAAFSGDPRCTDRALHAVMIDEYDFSGTYKIGRGMFRVGADFAGKIGENSPGFTMFIHYDG